MILSIFDDPRFDEHDPGPEHPEHPGRLRGARAGLVGLTLRARPVRLAAPEELCLVHDPAHVEDVLRADGETRLFDPDTVTSMGSVTAARCAAGAALDAADLLLAGEPSFVLCRPPGHHATRSRAMGFCLFNNAALAAERLRRAGRRVLVFDPDVHHGNGTEEIFYEEPDVLYVSCHRWPYYPGTGAATATGRGAGLGATLNLPMPPGAGDGHAQAAVRELLLPALDRFRPHCCVVSAGYDALAGDPLGDMRLSPRGLAAMWGVIVSRMPTLAVLEGGYSLENLREGIAATAAVLAGQPPPPMDAAAPPGWLDQLRARRHPLLRP